MATKHGVYVTENETTVSTPVVATSGIPFFIGGANLDEAENAATSGVPVLCTSWDEAVDKLGYSDADWDKYTLYEAMYSHFKLFNCQPAVFCAVKPEAEALTKDEIAAAVESVELCLTKFGIVPDLIVAPGFSSDSTVAAAMAAKADAINGMFKAKAICDLDSESYTAAIEAKNGGTYTPVQIVCWPMCKLGDKTFHLSTLLAGRMAATDTDNGGTPYESPDNKAIAVDSIVGKDGAEINMTKAQADALNAAGIVTALNFMGGFVAWGSYTAAYPKSTDVKDYFIPVSRMFAWVTNTIIQSFWSRIGKPMNRRHIDTILDSCNIWLNGLVGGGYLLGARVEWNEAENPDTDLMQGIIRFHVYMTPPSPMQEIDFVLEYDASYVSAALAS